MSGKKVVYIDMDGVLADFYKSYGDKYTKHMRFPQATQGFFEHLEPMKGAINAWNYLNTRYDLWIATAPSVLNPLCYTEKRLWVEKNLGSKAVNRLIIIPDKSLLIGDALIDDNTSGKGQEGFKGRIIKFTNWGDTLGELTKHLPNN